MAIYIIIYIDITNRMNGTPVEKVETFTYLQSHCLRGSRVR